MTHSQPLPILNPSSFPEGGKAPQPVLPQVWAFAPNRDTLGGTAYFLQHPQGNILIDSPPWRSTTADFLQAQGGVSHLLISHRGGMAQVSAWQEALGCQVWVQEQEAYLVPGVTVHTFQDDANPIAEVRGLWVPGHSPGSTCWYWPHQGGILFTGRHLLADRHGNPQPLYTRKTFHWPWQLEQVRRICEEFDETTLQHLCPGANIGLLQGRGTIHPAYDRLKNLDWQTLAHQSRDLL